MASGDKSEQPTQRRRQKAREKGQVVRSRELTAALALAAALATLSWSVPHWIGAWRGLFRTLLDAAVHGNLRVTSPVVALSGRAVLGAILPVLGASCAAAALGGLAQGGLVLAPSALAPSFNRINPATRLRQIFSAVGLLGLLKSLLPFAAIAYCAVGIVSKDWGRMTAATNADVHELAGLVAGDALAIAWRAVLVLLLWSGADYLLHWQKSEGDLKMSRQEIREEMKESEGHPAIKARIRRLQRQTARRRMVQDVARAAVVVTNPTHFAVALAYSPEMTAPTVVAKGQNLLALQIREAARWHNIPIMENPPLAQALYRWTEVGDMIPAKLYAAVAELLAFVFRAQQRAAAAATARRKG
jgi:flagellar biosynthetic protein FlhB